MDWSPVAGAFAELGFGLLTISAPNWNGSVGPAGLPAEWVVQHLVRTMRPPTSSPQRRKGRPGQEGFLGLDYSTPPGVTGIDLKSDFLRSGRPSNGGSPAMMSPTSSTVGTTGRPRAIATDIGRTCGCTPNGADLADLRQGDRYLIVNPFFHTFGYKAGCIASMIRSATVFADAGSRWTGWWTSSRPNASRCSPGPPTLYHSLLDVARRDLSGPG